MLIYVSRIRVEEPGRPVLTLTVAHPGKRFTGAPGYWPHTFEKCVRQLLAAGAGPQATWTVHYEPLP